MEKKPWLARTRPWPPQVGHCLGLEPGLAPVPEQASQAIEVGTVEVAVLPLEGLLERDLEIVAQVGAALAARCRRAAAAPADEVAEQVVEDVGHRGGEIVAEARAAAAAVSKAAWPKRS